MVNNNRRIIILIAILVFIVYIYTHKKKEKFSDINEGNWEIIPNMNYMYGMVDGAGTTNSNYVYLGKVGNIEECIQKAKKDVNNIYQNVVYTKANSGPSGSSYNNMCYGNIKGTSNNPVKENGVTTALAQESYMNQSLYFDLKSINRKKCIIAVSNINDNTYKGVQNNTLGTVINNDNSKNTYQPKKSNINNRLYDTVFVYTGQNGGVESDNIKTSTQNSVNFHTVWEIIKNECPQKNTYLIRNIKTNRFLGCGNLTENSFSNNINQPIVYLSNENSITNNHLWNIETQGKNNYYIKSEKYGQYLFSLLKDINFVTNAIIPF